MEMNLANKLTMLRVVMIPVFLVVLLSPFVASPYNRYIAVAIFVVASLTDFLDGYIARSRNMVSNFGKFMDPLADKLLVSAALISMVTLKDLQAWVVILIISREFIITGFRTLAAEANIIMAASIYGKIKTTVQMIMIIVLLFNFQGQVANFVENTLIVLAVIFTILSAVDYIVKNKQVLKG